MKSREELSTLFWEYIEPDSDAYSNHLKLLLMRLSVDELEDYLRNVMGVPKYDITGDPEDKNSEDED